MTRPIPSRHDSPWYREPWPWIIFGLPGAAVVASFVTLYIALTHADALVVGDYYRQGLAINRVLARDHLAFERHYRADVTLSPDRTMLRVQLTGGPLPTGLRLRFVHPTQAGLDDVVRMREIQPGLYEAGMQLAKSARWGIDLEDAGRTWRMSGDWHPQDDHFVIEPSAK